MADVCLILEGTYPYVTGGVSSWVHNLICALPRLRFSLLTIVPSRDSYREYQYDVPENVVGVSEVHIHDGDISKRKNRGSSKEGFAALAQFYRAISHRDYAAIDEVFRLVCDPETRVVSPEDLLMHKQSWEMATTAYEEMQMEDSFIDFFWTWRYIHLPLLRLIDARIPTASVYHAVSTGYAGMLAALAKLKTGSPVLLTEHGIYSNERRIEIEQARWIYERKSDTAIVSTAISPFKKMWISLFDHLSHITYRHADEVITLFENNRKLQVLGGAEPSRTSVIPNGIDLTHFNTRKKVGDNGENFQVGFVGRVVSIKDVKTFIRACKIVHEHFPQAHFPIMGPTEEEQEYFEECRSMVEMLGLNSFVEFTGRVDVRQQYPRMDVVVLTSISEAQPLVILEANICNVPCVATDVGACSELINGRTPEDIALGPCGLITPIAAPEATAAAIITILADEDLRRAMGASGTERVARFYDMQDLNFAYLDLYRRYITSDEQRRQQQEDARAWPA